MDRSLLYLILFLLAVWLLLDDLFGQKRVSRVITLIVPGNQPLVGEGSKISEEQQKDQSTATGIPKDGIDSILTPPVYD